MDFYIYDANIFCSYQENIFVYQFKLPHRDPRDVGGESLEVVEGGGGVPHNEVDGDEEAAQDDAEGAGDDGEDDVLLCED